jgi:hypothetical protein
MAAAVATAGVTAARPGITDVNVILLLGRLAQHHLDFVKCELLYDFVGEPGYSAAQGA